MRGILAICSIAVLASVAATVATAAQPAGGWALTASKAERMLVRDATVRLSTADKVALEEELLREVRRFRALELAAKEVGNNDAWWIYNGVANRYWLALQTVQSGLGIEDADCTGTGRSIAGKRFQRFSCLVTSEVLHVPAIELAASDGDGLPTLLESEPRDVGPLFTQLRVRVTGRSRIEYR